MIFRFKDAVWILEILSVVHQYNHVGHFSELK
jgi:hypothetical protein